ncbi:MAG: RagB/SusD family nutrient uptake outer membrane protein, partial [Bacteroidales bacterium]|nr:RagB/SusD family nutrient uptake outer membrane protein [Bacteroidales bacterium]
MKRFNILLIVLALGVMTSCEKFFSLTPNYEVPVDNLYQTAQDFDIAVVGCYAKLQGQVNYYTELCEYRSDNMFLSAPTAGTQDRYDIDQFKDNASNGILEEAWANFNNGVYRCNMVLDRIDGADFDEALKNQYKGEAMFIRALTYFNMYRIWGGVPTTRKVVTVAESLTIGRSSDDEMYNFIAGDLEDIVEGAWLPASYSGAGVGRVTIGAAKALLAKVYLTFGKHQEAVSLLQSMIGSYELLDNIADVFDVANENNKEIIFSVRFNKEVPGEGHGAWFSIANLSDDSGRTDILDNLYENNDARKSLIEYKKVDGVNAYLMKKFFDQRDATNKNYGNDQIILRYADVLLMYA